MCLGAMATSDTMHNHPFTFFLLVFLLSHLVRIPFFMFAEETRWGKTDWNTIHSLKSITWRLTLPQLCFRDAYRYHKLKHLINVSAEVLKIKTLFATANNNRWIENEKWIRLEKEKQKFLCLFTCFCFPFSYCCFSPSMFYVKKLFLVEN